MRRILAVLLVVTGVLALAPPAAHAEGHGAARVAIGLATFALFAPFIILGEALAQPLGEVLALSAPYRAPAVVVAPAPADAAPPAYVRQADAAPNPAQPTVIQYPHGRYELLGDGIATAYQWVWIPNPTIPPSPPSTPVAGSPPLPSTAAWTASLEQVPSEDLLIHAPSQITSSVPTRDEQMDQRVARVEGRIEAMNQRLDTVDGRVQTLQGGVAHAQSSADAAAQKASGVDSRLTRLWSNRFNQKTASSLEVFFAPDSIELSDAAQTALLGVVEEMEANPQLTVELGGYTDSRGAIEYNYALSQQRVDTVRRFLMNKGIQLARIQSASLGPITSGNMSDAKKRRVIIRLMVDSD
jgi:outer membrane protein OmpA-like peptidoglycan-associated protein